jgi:hypothetical protein
MPFTKDGTRPDMIINPHALPSRMTIGHLVECLMGKACLSVGGFGDGTAFINKGSKVRVFGDILTQMNYHSSGNEIFYNGMTGEQLEAQIFFGPTYYMRLKHMVKDKINYRALGPRTALTKQPVSGRANDGGLRIGEMERDAVAAHGIANFLTESMMERGDKYHIAVCNTTGMLAVCNPAKNLFMSPMADGPIKFVGSLDGKEIHVENITKYGRSFSVVSLPYSMKLLMQELQTINVQMRIITEDTLPQLENMMFSHNIHHLMGLPIPKNNEHNELNVYTDKYTKTKREPPKKETDIFTILENEKRNESSPEWFISGGQGAKHPTTNSSGGLEEFGEKRTPPPKIKIRDSSNDPDENVIIEIEDVPDDFEKGQYVHYRGDSTMGSTLRLWEIMDVSPHFITIQSMSDTMSPDPELFEEDIKVVKPNEIYRPGDIPQDHVLVPPLFMQQPDQNEYVQNADGQWVPFQPTINPNYQNTQQDPNKTIHFAPVINVVAGDNTGTIDLDSAQPTATPITTNTLPGGLEEVYVKGISQPDESHKKIIGTSESATQNDLLSTGVFSIKKMD